MENDLLGQGGDCVYVGSSAGSNSSGGGASSSSSRDGAVCRPGLSFRRLMLGSLEPAALKFRCVRRCCTRTAGSCAGGKAGVMRNEAALCWLVGLALQVMMLQHFQPI